MLGARLNISSGAHNPLPSSKHILEPVCIGLLPLQAVYIAISAGCPLGSVILIKTLSGTELVVKENQVIGVFPLSVHKTLPPVDDDVLKFLQTPSICNTWALVHVLPWEKVVNGRMMQKYTMRLIYFIGLDIRLIVKLENNPFKCNWLESISWNRVSTPVGYRKFTIYQTRQLNQDDNLTNIKVNLYSFFFIKKHTEKSFFFNG